MDRSSFLRRRNDRRRNGSGGGNVIEEFLTHWGLPAVFFGTIAEGDAVAFLAGVMAHRRLFAFEAAALAVAFGAFVVDQVMFRLGRRAEAIGVARRALARPAAQKARDLVRRREALFCLGFRFVWGMKTLGALAAGAAGVRPWRFAGFDLLAVLAWAHVLVALGYGAGQGIEHLFGRLALHLHLGLAMVLVAALAGALLLWHRHRRSLEPGAGGGHGRDGLGDGGQGGGE